MKKPTPTASHIRKPATSQPATLDPQTAAVGFLQTNQLAFHGDPKRFFIFVEKRQSWYLITIKQLRRRLRRWALDTHKHSVSSAALKKIVAELEVAAPRWTTPVKPGVFGYRQLSAEPPDDQQPRVNCMWKRWTAKLKRLWQSLTFNH